MQRTRAYIVYGFLLGILLGLTLISVLQIYYWYDEYVKWSYPWKHGLGYKINQQKRDEAYSNWIRWNGILVVFSILTIATLIPLWKAHELRKRNR